MQPGTRQILILRSVRQECRFTPVTIPVPVTAVREIITAMKNKLHRLTTAIAIALTAVLSLSGCSRLANNDPLPSSFENLEDGKLKVAVSFYPMYDFASKIGADQIDLINLVPSGTEPHDWEPSASDLTNLEKADVFVYSGAGMEHWVDRVLNSLTNENLTVVEASSGIALRTNGSDEDEDHDHDEEEDHTDHNEHDDHDEIHADHDDHDDHDEHDEHDHSEDEDHADHDHDSESTGLFHFHTSDSGHSHSHDGGLDPHVWLNPEYAKKEMENIKNAFVSADPKNKDFYEANYEKYAAEFDRLDEDFHNTIETLPNREIVVAHEAYGYLCDAYGLTQVGIEGLTPDSEPTPRRMARIIDFVREHHVKVIFFEALTSSKSADTVAAETGITTSVLNPLEGLSAEEIEAGSDYLSVMRDNLNALCEALSE